MSWRRLDIPGLDRLTGAGVYYGAAQTEAMTCQDEDVFVVGGANSAGQAGMYFSKYARHVTMLVRGESLVKSMSQYLIEQIAETPNITVQPYSSAIEVKGDDTKRQFHRLFLTLKRFCPKNTVFWRHGSIERVASGVGEGSICVQFVHQYLANVGS